MTETQLPQNVDVCTISDIGLELTGDDAPPLIDTINDYLSCFAKPVEHDKGDFMFGKHACINCGKPLSGVVGSFVWALAHGEGKCSECGWPARAYHNPQHDGADIFNRRLEIVLQYHPSCVAKAG